jgi:hypothetical protein
MKATSFLARLFPSPAQSAAIEEAVSLAAGLEDQPNLCRWLVTGIAASPSESAALLTRAAQTLRDELQEFVTATALERMARDPQLLKAVIRELRRGRRNETKAEEATLTSAAA